MIRVLIVDDSALVRKMLTAELSRHHDIEVVGAAPDAATAREMIVDLDPDVLTLDVGLPEMDGLTFLEILMRQTPLPVVVVSSFTRDNPTMAQQAKHLGAAGVVHKNGHVHTLPGTDPLVTAIRNAARLKRRAHRTIDQMGMPPVRMLGNSERRGRVLTIGASTGGTVAIESILRRLPANTPGTLIVQHMPRGFTANFAERLNRITSMEVREARDRDPILPGLALLAPGGFHMVMEGNAQGQWVRLTKQAPVHFQRPAVDVTFESVAHVAGRRSLAVLLTGMGMDGARGMLAVREAGGYTIAEDESTCVVFGMPKEAIQLGAACDVLPLHEIPEEIIARLSLLPTL